MVRKNNKSGFTLVELLAVIVILAVVILIAVTAVIPRMNNAKRKAFIDEALIYLKAGKEAYTAEDTECFNINNFDSYIKNSKDNYSGTLFVNEKGATLNLTDGKYYIITSGNPVDYDVVETKPTNFVTSCSDTSKTFTIEYDLNGGTLGVANPSSYNFNTPTIVLNNPTKAGYKFVGWSSKNILNFQSNPKSANGVYSEVNNNEIYINGTNTKKDAAYGLINSYTPIIIEDGISYTLSSDKAMPRAYVQINYIKTSTNTQASLSVIGSNTLTRTFTMPSDYKESKYAFLGINRECDDINLKFHVQLEEGSVATDFQEYMEPTASAKIYRGSVGNKKFIANWEAL